MSDQDAMSEQRTFGFETRAVHAGAAPDPATGARATPIYQTTSYVFDDVEDAASLFNLQKMGFIYSRLTNPTVSVLEERIASLEGGRGATATSSGHAAQMLTFFALMSPGEEFLSSRKLYGGSLNQFANSFPRAFGWKAIFVDGEDADSYRRALTPKTKAIFIESLANPGGVVSDIEAIAEVAREADIPLIVDNTMATPYLCRPIEHGADAGRPFHHQVPVRPRQFGRRRGRGQRQVRLDQAGKYPALTEPEPGYHGLRFHETFGDLAFTIHGHAIGLRDLGPNQQPMNAFLTITGIETLALRMERHCANALKVARVSCKATPTSPGSTMRACPTSPYHELARKYMPKGAGSVFTFGLKGGFEAGVALVEGVELFSHLANIGDTRSLIIHPASTTHRQLSEEGLKAAGATADVVRSRSGSRAPKTSSPTWIRR